MAVQPVAEQVISELVFSEPGISDQALSKQAISKQVINEQRFALCRRGSSGFLVIEGPDDHLASVVDHRRAWSFPCQESASLAARTIARLTGCPIEVVSLP